MHLYKKASSYLLCVLCYFQYICCDRVFSSVFHAILSIFNNKTKFLLSLFNILLCLYELLVLLDGK